MPETAAATVLMVRAAWSRSMPECDLACAYRRQLGGDTRRRIDRRSPLPIASIRAAEFGQRRMVIHCDRISALIRGCPSTTPRPPARPAPPGGRLQGGMHPICSAVEVGRAKPAR